MVNGRPDNMTHAGRIIWHRWPFWMTICTCKVLRVFYAILTKGVDYDGEKMLGDIRRPERGVQAA
ncbi:hypothetical protein DXB59_18570 [Ruminococcus sp. OM05-10BH]|nr:hypothetical protein DXB59_18570 [Ruminococcus sp. OM05-10BH]